MVWDHRQYGSASDPIRQSDLNSIASSYSCSKRFAFEKEASASGADREQRVAYGARVVGSAVHNVIDRVLAKYAPEDGLPEVPAVEHVERALRQEIDRESGGLDIVWGKGKDIEKEVADGVTMVTAALERLRHDAAEILLHESAFAVQVDAGRGKDPYWVTGTVDLIYRARDGRLVLADWKTGQRVSSQLVLDHGYQLGLYAHALAEGVFFPAYSREAVEEAISVGGRAWDRAVEIEGRRIGSYPDELYLVFLRDHLLYSRKSTKTVTRPEEAEFWGVQIGDKVTNEKGAPKGPAWYRARRSEADIARLKVSLQTIVGTVRLGRFVEHIGDDTCGKCRFKDVCLNQGYEASGDERRELDKALRGLDLSAFDEELDAAQ